MTDSEQRIAAKAFAKEWKDKGYEKGESQSFWLSLLRDVLGVEHPEQFITFEEQVHLDHTSFIDGYIPKTKVLIEQKGLGKDLNKPIKQSDGTLLTPFQQAKRYITELPVSQHPRWVVTCNFAEFYVYDMERPGGEPEKIKLAELEKDYYRLSFLTDTGNVHLHREMEVSMKAGEIVGLLYDALQKQYIDPNNEKTLKSLNKLCVRLVFCLYAEDAGIFGRREMFHDYLAKYETEDLREALVRLFRVLDQKPEERDPYLKKSLAEFPYVNGGLFKDENIEIPQMTDEIKDLLLNKASAGFDWSEISPTIFGAVFESTLNPETRRKGGMHYTSIENIHKVIDPLFLDDLKKELEEIEQIKVVKTREEKLYEFQDKLASLTFLDPACGSGNFLTETYLSLRRLENQILIDLQGNQMVWGGIDPIKVSISQFYGIEINDFAVTVAKTALWIAESQTMKETENIVLMHLDFLPLKTNAFIQEENSLTFDWNKLIGNTQLNYIMGNPPFVGGKLMTPKQRKEIKSLYGDIPLVNSIDYVSGWYIKAAQYMYHAMPRQIKTAFVSTNSISQGQQVYPIWHTLLNGYRITINFAYRTFIWDSEANLKAHVHCVIIGFACYGDRKKWIYSPEKKEVNHINPYLIDAQDILVQPRAERLCKNEPECKYGSLINDKGNYIFTEEELQNFLKEEPNAQKFIRPYMGSREYINHEKRYILYLKGISPTELRSMPAVLDRVKKVEAFRRSSSASATVQSADRPTTYFYDSTCDGTFLIIPRTSSEKRRYIPIGFMNPEVVASDATAVVPNATLYHFGVLISNVHMSWMRTVCGRLKSDYRYAPKTVYNTFPWPNPSIEQKSRIEQTAQEILDARAKYQDSSLADLYDDVAMPPELRKAHQHNDAAVLAAYGITSKDEAYKSESACVAFLMKRYKEIADEK